ncbi:hypothetical protein BXZ70DRAFT_922991, partial [Cristinia sonorae]
MANERGFGWFCLVPFIYPSFSITSLPTLRCFIIATSFHGRNGHLMCLLHISIQFGLLLALLTLMTHLRL